MTEIMKKLIVILFSTAVGFISEFDFFEHIAIPLKFGFGGKLPYESSLGFVFVLE